MTCSEFRELAALYAAGGLSAEERAAAEAHLAEPKHEGCFEVLRNASVGVEMLARSLVPAQPDDRVWRGIEAGLGVTASRRMSERLAWGVAAAAVLLLIASLAMRQQESRRVRDRETQLTAMAHDADEAKAQCLAQIASMKGESDAQRERASS